MTVRARAVDAGYWLAWNTLWVLPTRMSRGLFDLLARAAWRAQGTGARQLTLNVARVTGLAPESMPVRNAAREALRSYMRYYCETFLLPRWTAEQITAMVRVVNEDHLADAIRDGGAIITLPHSGNWDLAGAWCAHRYVTVGTVAERLRPEGVFRKFMAMRAAHGIELMPLTGETGIYEYLRNHVNVGHLVALLGDRDVARNGMTNDFFGHKATLPIGAALLAIDTGRPLLTCSTHFEGPTLVITIDPPIPVDSSPVSGRDRLRRAQQVTAQVIARFEAHIAAHPEAWFQMQPVWADLTAQDVVA